MIPSSKKIKDRKIGVKSSQSTVQGDRGFNLVVNDRAVFLTYIPLEILRKCTVNCIWLRAINLKKKIKMIGM